MKARREFTWIYRINRIRGESVWISASAEMTEVMRKHPPIGEEGIEVSRMRGI